MILILVLDVEQMLKVPTQHCSDDGTVVVAHGELHALFRRMADSGTLIGAVAMPELLMKRDACLSEFRS